MPSSPRTRPGRRWLTLAGLALGLAILATGCESLRFEWGDLRHRPADPPATTEVEPAGLGSTGAVTAPGKHATRRGYYVFYHDFELDRADPLFAELEELPDQVFGELQLPPSNTIVQVFLFDTQDRYERFMKTRYRHLPARRAYFIAEPRVGGGTDELKVFTWMGDHLRTDLRHELTHALLHSVLKDVPLWLDEGLAGFFELPPDADGVNALHLEVIRRGPFYPDLARLEKLDQVRQMEKPEYREAWAWVYLMLRGSPDTKKVLHQYLQTLRGNPNPGPLLPRLRDQFPDPEQALADHLAGVELPRARSKPRATTPR